MAAEGEDAAQCVDGALAEAGLVDVRATVAFPDRLPVGPAEAYGRVRRGSISRTFVAVA